MFQKYLNMRGLTKGALCGHGSGADQRSNGGSSLCAGLPGNFAVGHGGDNRRFIYHSSSCIGAGMPGAASDSLWLGTEYFTQGSL